MSSLSNNKYFEQINCPNCGIKNFKTYIEVKYSDLKQKESLDYACIGIDQQTKLRTVKCNNCSMVFTNPRPTKLAESKVYNEAKKNKYLSLNDHSELTGRDVKRRLGYAKSLLSAINEFKSDQKLVIFDFGSGFGHSLILSEALGHTAYGIEIDNKRLEICKSKNLKVSKPENFFNEFKNVKADLIFMQSVIEHVVDLNGTFDFIDKIAKKGTVLYLNGIHPKLIDIERKRGLFVKAHFIEHINYFYIKTLDQFLLKKGFKPIKKRTYNKNVNSISQLFKTLIQLLIPIGFIANYTGYFDRAYKKIK